jgi:hypothetical protein
MPTPVKPVPEHHRALFHGLLRLLRRERKKAFDPARFRTKADALTVRILRAHGIEPTEKEIRAAHRGAAVLMKRLIKYAEGKH